MGNEGNEGLGYRAAFPTDLQNHEFITPHKEAKDLAADYVKVKGENNALTTKYNEAGNKITDYEGKLKNALFVPGADAKPEDVQGFNSKIDGYVKDNIIKGKYIPVLKENATEQEVNDYLNALGRPAKADDYKFDEFKIPENVNLKPKTVEEFKENVPKLEAWAKQIFHAAGLNPAMAKVVRDNYIAMELKAAQQKESDQEKAKQEGMTKLKTDWGADYDANYELVTREVDRLEKVVPGFKKWADDTGLGNDPILVRVFNEYARSISDDALIRSTKSKTDQREPGTLNYPTMKKT